MQTRIESKLGTRLWTHQNRKRSNRTLNDMLNKQKGMKKKLQNRFHSALLTLNFMNTNQKGTTAAGRHWIIDNNYRIKSAGIL